MSNYRINILFLFAHISFFIAYVQRSSGSMPIVVKDDGIAELKKGDVAMIFYVTVSNTGHQPIRLTINGTKCCQKITQQDEDCESMKLIGGEMGALYPRDSRNLTLLYINLYPHDRVGICDVLITDDKGGSLARSIKFNTTLVSGGKVHVPRLLEQYYEPEDVMKCDSVDKDPLNRCAPYICDIRYDGVRSRFNYVSGRCEKIPRCMPETKRKDDFVAYDVETGTCKRLITAMTGRDFAEFKDGKPSVHTLSHEHGYPINVRCHNGKIDKKGHWCECNEGWSSAPFDHKFFNPDIQVYHMCTVWKGEMNAEEARNITVKPKSHHRRTNIIIFTFLGLSFFLLVPLLLYILYKMRLSKRLAKALDQSEMELLTETTNESD